MSHNIGTKRSYIEIDLGALRRNVETLSSLLPEGCELMPAVKANAYGHGAVLVSKELNRLGVNAFCVATAAEGAELRENGIKGCILVMGYTPPAELHLLCDYDLIQTVVDREYAAVLNEFGKKIKVHIGIDTGMHRLGIRAVDIESILEIFKLNNLIIDGIFSHLCVADSMLPAHREFSKMQGRTFWDCVEKLQSKGLSCGDAHILSSYGLLHYPELGGKYARVGIALFGYLETEADATACPVKFEPVLSLKTKIATVKELKKGESIGYGLKFTAPKDSRIAVLGIGYADGVPRALSCGVGSVLINGKKAAIIGNICMDQMTVDVSEISEARAGDDAVVIGSCGGEAISAYEIASSTGSITNEVLSRLGARPERIPVSPEEE